MLTEIAHLSCSQISLENGEVKEYPAGLRSTHYGRLRSTRYARSHLYHP
ncbi:hypothetical protein [Cylindrospermopsis raciborskii]|nr:hypothetical protein [Cylindrospermopsis raciborskii]